MRSPVTAWIGLSLLGCDTPVNSNDASAPSARSVPAVASQTAAASSATGEHAQDDCRPARPLRAAAAGPPLTSLRADARERLTALRVSAHVGSVILRSRATGWFTSGENGCRVPASRMKRALDDLTSLKAEPTSERPANGQSFELQIVAEMGEERALYLDVAGHGERGDLVQLVDGSTFRVRGLERDLWSPNPRDWCVDP
jgi:hypothetical protein